MIVNLLLMRYHASFGWNLINPIILLWSSIYLVAIPSIIWCYSAILDITNSTEKMFLIRLLYIILRPAFLVCIDLTTESMNSEIFVSNVTILGISSWITWIIYKISCKQGDLFLNYNQRETNSPIVKENECILKGKSLMQRVKRYFIKLGLL